MPEVPASQLPTDAPEAVITALAVAPEDARQRYRIITRGQLDLIKALRAEGFAVRVDGDPDLPVRYLSEKGEPGALVDLIDILVGGVGGVATGLVANALFQWGRTWLRREPEELSEGEKGNVCLRIKGNDGAITYGEPFGLPSSDDQRRALLHQFDRVQRGRDQALARQSPYPGLPVPMFLEHSDKIVGWANPVIHPRGLKVEPCKIDDDETWRRVKAKELNGFSVALLVESSICSVCDSEYRECEHIAGLSYGDARCVVTLAKVRITEVSIVKEPVNPGAVISPDPI